MIMADAPDTYKDTYKETAEEYARELAAAKERLFGKQGNPNG